MDEGKRSTIAEDKSRFRPMRKMESQTGKSNPKSTALELEVWNHIFLLISAGTLAQKPRNGFEYEFGLKQQVAKPAKHFLSNGGAMFFTTNMRNRNGWEYEMKMLKTNLGKKMIHSPLKRYKTILPMIDGTNFALVVID